MTPGGRIGLGVVAILVTLALFAPVVAIHDPGAPALAEGLRGPTLEHPLGQDRLGRDLWSRVVWGARVSLVVSTFTVAVSLVIGTFVGLVAGMKGGWVEEIAMRFVDVLLAFPGILLAIALAAVLGPSLVNVILALSLIGWTGYARLVRAETRSLRTRPHVEAVRALGASEVRVVFRHVLPLLAAPLAVQATFGFAGAVVAESSLSFLGLGVQPPAPSWGAMLDEGRTFLFVAPHVAIVPGATLCVTVLAVNFLGDALRDWLDVRG